MPPNTGPLYPKMKALEAEKAELDQKIKTEVNRLAGAMASDVMVARAHLASLEASLGGTVHQQTAQKSGAGGTGCAAIQCGVDPARNMKPSLDACARLRIRTWR